MLVPPAHRRSLLAGVTDWLSRHGDHTRTDWLDRQAAQRATAAFTHADAAERATVRAAAHFSVAGQVPRCSRDGDPHFHSHIVLIRGGEGWER